MRLPLLTCSGLLAIVAVGCAADDPVFLPTDATDVDAVVIDADPPDANLPDGTVDADVDAAPPPVLLVDPIGLQLDEGSSDALFVRLDSPPPTTLYVALVCRGEYVACAPATLVFTEDNFAVAQTVTVNGVQDIDAAIEHTEIELTSPSLAPVTVDVTVHDDDRLEVIATPPAVSLSEGDTREIAVKLSAQPEYDTFVSPQLTGSGAHLVDAAALAFTPENWNTAQLVAVVADEDDDVVGASVHLGLIAAGVFPGDVVINIADNDAQGIDIAEGPGPITVPEGQTRSFHVALLFAPAGTVTVALNTGDVGAVAVSPAILTFNATNYALPQQVTLTGVQDVDVADEAVMVAVSSTGLPTRTVPVNVDDDDIQRLVVSTAAVSVTEGDTVSFRVRLAFMPPAAVNVLATTGINGVVDIISPVLTFTPATFNVDKTITLRAPLDGNAVSENGTVQVLADGMAAATVTVHVIDRTQNP